MIHNDKYRNRLHPSSFRDALQMNPHINDMYDSQILENSMLKGDGGYEN